MSIFIILLIGVILFLLVKNNELSIDKRVLEKETDSSHNKTYLPIIDSEYDNLINNYLKKRSAERSSLINDSLNENKSSEWVEYGFTQEIMTALKNKYEHIGKLREELAWVGQKDRFGKEKYGFVNEAGILVIPLTFTYVDDFHEGLAVVSPTARKTLQVFGGKLGAINENGNYVLLPEYDDLRKFNEGLAGVLVDGKWGFIDKKGDMVITPQYLSIYEDFKDGLAIVEKEWAKWYYIDKNGKGNRMCDVVNS